MNDGGICDGHCDKSHIYRAVAASEHHHLFAHELFFDGQDIGEAFALELLLPPDSHALGLEHSHAHGYYHGFGMIFAFGGDDNKLLFPVVYICDLLVAPDLAFQGFCLGVKLVR